MTSHPPLGEPAGIIPSSSFPPSNPSLPAGEGKSPSPATLHDGSTVLPDTAQQKDQLASSPLRQNVFMIFITLTQLVQMIPLGAGINSSLSIGEALDATAVESVWIVASYPLTQGAFVLIGMPLLRHVGTVRAGI